MKMCEGCEMEWRTGTGAHGDNEHCACYWEGKGAAEAILRSTAVELTGRLAEAEQENAALRERVIEAARDHGPLYLHEIEALIAPASEPAKIGHAFVPWPPSSGWRNRDSCMAKGCARPESEHEPAPEKEANRE